MLSFIRLLFSTLSDYISNMRPERKALRTPSLSHLFDLCEVAGIDPWDNIYSGMCNQRIGNAHLCFSLG
jgi:hypothetical protein